MADPATTPAATTAGPDTKEDEVAKWLAGGFSIVTAVLTGLGAVGGSLQRLFLNHGFLASIGFGLLALAIGLSVIAYVGNWDRRRQHGLLKTAGVSFAAGLAIVTALAVITPSASAQPAITASFKSTGDMGLVLTASVKAEHLKAKTGAVLTVEGLRRRQGRGLYRAAGKIYQAELGPDSDGVIERSIEVPVPVGSFGAIEVTVRVGRTSQTPGRRHCDSVNPDPHEGCVILRVPTIEVKPQLTAAWDAGSDRLSIDLEVSGTGMSRDKLVVLRVDGIRQGHGRTNLYSAVLSPDELGKLGYPLSLPVDQRLSHVCIAATSVNLAVVGTSDPLPVPHCGDPNDHATVWTRLLVPKG